MVYRKSERVHVRGDAGKRRGAFIETEREAEGTPLALLRQEELYKWMDARRRTRRRAN